MAEKDFRVKRGIHVGTDAYISNSITSVNAISFATNANVDPVLGMLTWDETYQTLDLGLSDQVSAHLGQDSYFFVKNQTGSTITKGTAVQAAGTVGASGTILISKAIANGSVSSKLFMGLAASDIPDGEDGYVLEFGKLRQANTIAFSAGDILYVNPAVPGGLSNTLPVAPNNKVTVAFVINRSENQGVLAVRPAVDTRLAELQDVYINGITNGQIIKWVSANSRFESATLTSAPTLNVALANSSNIATNVVSGVSTLLFDTDSGLDIVNLGSGNVKVQLNSTFKTWEVDGQESLIAQGLDNVRFVAGDGIVITTNALATPKSISFGWNANSWVNANDYATLLSAWANDYSTLLSARANDYSTYTALDSNVYNTYTVLQANIDAVQDNVAALSGSSNLVSELFTTVSTSNTFTLSQSVSDANNILVSLSGIVQYPAVGYVVAGTTLTISNTFPMTAGLELEVRYLQTTGGGGGGGGGSGDTSDVANLAFALSFFF
jgi:hypothetical protein